MDGNNAKGKNNNLNFVLQSDKTSANNGHIATPLISAFKEKRDGEKEPWPKASYGLFKKSLFSASALREIETADLSEEDRLIIQRVKLHRLINYKEKGQVTDQLEMNLMLKYYEPINEPKFSNEDDDILENFFQHTECSASCNFEVCSEIREMLACYEKCKATKNFDCSLCGFWVETDLYIEEFRKIQESKIWNRDQKTCELIQSYDGFKAIKLESDLHNKSLFSASAHHDLQNFSDQEKDDVKMVKLLRVLHSQHCFEDCTYPDCKLLKKVGSHSSECSNGVSCTFENCLEVKELLSHWKLCLEEENFKCPLCGDYLSRYFILLNEFDEINEEIHEKVLDLGKRQKLVLEKYRKTDYNPSKLHEFLSFF